MSKKTIINLPVKDLVLSKEFFTKIGFAIDATLSDDNALCIAISAETTVALLPIDHFSQATNGKIADTPSVHEVLISISKDSERAVNQVVDLALENGATELHKPIRLAHMYGRSFSDLDGHQWNLFYEFA